MKTSLIDLLLIQSFNLDTLIEDYRNFFLALLPSIFVLACLVEFFDRIDTYNLVRRSIISILILSSVTMFYKSSIHASIDAANSKLNEQKQSNLLLLDFFDAKNEVSHLEGEDKAKFYKEKNILTGTISFLKYHLFDSFINDSFTTVVYFISQLCLVLIKLVYSLVYYLGYGLVGIPCLIYLFPSMGNILRGSILTFVWCLIVPHILVFILSMIGSEIERGYSGGHVIGGSVTGTTLLFLLTLFIAFTPLIGMMIVNGSGIAQAGGVIAGLGANHIMAMPMKSLNTATTMATGGKLGPKMQFAKNTSLFGTKIAKGLTKKATSNPSIKEGSKKRDSEKTGISSKSSNKVSDSNVSYNPSQLGSRKGSSHLVGGNNSQSTKFNYSSDEIRSKPSHGRVNSNKQTQRKVSNTEQNFVPKVMRPTKLKTSTVRKPKRKSSERTKR
ncbi:MAG: hypothetical protein ACJAS4_002864 [Bacteriovoracaceae bacterium]|jgi:hypothetical protein